MNYDSNCRFDTLKRIHSFILENPIEPQMVRAAAAHAEIVTSIAALEAAVLGQDSGLSEAGGGVDARELTAAELRAYLKNVARTGRTLETDHPGISASFRMPKTGSYPALIVRAKSIIAAATPIQAAFVESGLPGTFLTELQALLTAFETATSQKHSGGITRVDGTATIKDAVDRGVQAARRLDACVRNQHRNNPGKLAAWGHARRIERPARNAAAPAPGSVPNAPAQS